MPTTLPEPGGADDDRRAAPRAGAPSRRSGFAQQERHEHQSGTRSATAARSWRAARRRPRRASGSAAGRAASAPLAPEGSRPSPALESTFGGSRIARIVATTKSRKA